MYSPNTNARDMPQGEGRNTAIIHP